MKKVYSFSVDSRLRISSWGEEITKLTGKSASTTLGKNYYKVFPQIFSGEKDALSLALEKNKKITLKEYYFNCPLDHFKVDIEIDPLRTAKGDNGVKISISHISTCSIIQKLQSSQRFIDIGKTASTLAHGVRNPLNAIKGAVVYLSEKYAKEPALIEFTKIMKEEISRIDNFISQFLSTSFSYERFSLTDINSLLKKIEVLTFLQTHTYNIRSIYEYGDIPSIMINYFQIEQAILNVINNAIEAMRSGGELKVRTQLETLTGIDFVTIKISDTGPGIAETRIDVRSIPTEDKGKGFGLFITREIIQYHNGHLEIKSKKGKGTTVKLYLPINSIGEVK